MHLQMNTICALHDGADRCVYNVAEWQGNLCAVANLNRFAALAAALGKSQYAACAVRGLGQGRR